MTLYEYQDPVSLTVVNLTERSKGELRFGERTFSLYTYQSHYRMETIRIKWPRFINQSHFILCSFVRFLTLHFCDAHTWFGECTRRLDASAVPECPLVGAAVLPTFCACVYIFNPKTVFKKKNHRVNGEFSSLQSSSPVKKDTKNIAGRCYLLKLFTKILEQNGRMGNRSRFCQHSFVFANCHIYSCLIGMASESRIMQNGKVLNGLVQN